MPGTTPKLGFPYPLPGEDISQGATAIEALALAVEDQVSGRGTALITVNLAANGTMTTTAISHGCPRTPLAVVATPSTANFAIGVTNITSTTFQIAVRNIAGGAVNFLEAFNWVAIA